MFLGKSQCYPPIAFPFTSPAVSPLLLSSSSSLILRSRSTCLLLSSCLLLSLSLCAWSRLARSCSSSSLLLVSSSSVSFFSLSLESGNQYVEFTQNESIILTATCSYSQLYRSSLLSSAVRQVSLEFYSAGTHSGFIFGSNNVSVHKTLIFSCILLLFLLFWFI